MVERDDGENEGRRRASMVNKMEEWRILNSCLGGKKREFHII